MIYPTYEKVILSLSEGRRRNLPEAEIHIDTEVGYYMNYSHKNIYL
jgi:hypothetical protein